jgi:hypothetical protein
MSGAYRSDWEELDFLRARYDYDNMPGMDPASYPRNQPPPKPGNDSGTDSPSHLELQDRLWAFLS